MPFRYLEGITCADIAFEATGATLDELFLSAADAVINVMVDDLASLPSDVSREIRLDVASATQEEALMDLLYGFLQKLIFYKDSEMLLLRVVGVTVATIGTARTCGLSLVAQARGGKIASGGFDLGSDVKGVTMHRFSVKSCAGGWVATVVLDT